MNCLLKQGTGTGWGKPGENYTGNVSSSDSDTEEVDEYGNKIKKHGTLKAALKGAAIGAIG
mgnify:CR=1 FL=1